MRVEGAFIYFTVPILGGIPITQTTFSLLIITIFLCCFSIFLGRRLKKRPDSLQALAEKGILMLHNMVVDTMGKQNAHWTPFIATIFLSSLCGSMIGLTGFLRSTTADLSCTLVWALMVSAISWYNGIKNNGFFGWLKGFTEPIAVMTPMNIISEIAQPVSMAFRHFGNIAGGGVITTLLYTALSLASSALLKGIAVNGWLLSGILITVGAALIFLWRRNGRKQSLAIGTVCSVLGFFGLLQVLGILSDVPILAYGIPAVLSCYFDIFSGFVQAYVFTLLTMVYISASLPENSKPHS